MSIFKVLTGAAALPGLLFTLLTPASVFADQKAVQICGEGSPFKHRRLDTDEEVTLCQQFKNSVVLIVNTASRCAFTDQYEGLEKLYATYKDRGLLVVGFPSNDFANQEPGSEKTIKDFCRLTYGVQFPMFGKTRVKGPDADPLYRSLSAAAGQSPRWNFHKYLLDREGRLVGSFSSFVKPFDSKLIAAIEQQL
jgi:glutathione peroxidase